MVTLRAAHGFIGATLTAIPFMSSLYALMLLGAQAIVIKYGALP
jgi:hypothetical protein